MTRPLAKKNVRHDVRHVACGGGHTALVTRGEGALVCGRASLCGGAITGTSRDHVHAPQLASAGALGEKVDGGGGGGPTSGISMGMTLRQVACGEAHTLFLTFSGKVLAYGAWAKKS